jgi:hypothetical protein
MHTLAAAGGRICTEHSAFNLETVVGLVAHGAGITPVVRITGLQYKHVTRYGTDLILLRRGPSAPRRPSRHGNFPQQRVGERQRR